MNRVAEFKKVSFEQFKKDWDYHNIASTDEEIKEVYDNIKIPKRATKGSAGYDFFIPFKVTIPKDTSLKIPTGIRCEMEEGWVLCEMPRSGIGFKYGISLSNTIGVIDSDYFYSNNEGHIFIKLLNDSCISDLLKFNEGDAFCQGIFLPYGVTYNDNENGVRNGGFGSTNK